VEDWRTHFADLRFPFVRRRHPKWGLVGHGAPIAALNSTAVLQFL